MKISLLKFRYILFGLLAFHLIFAFIEQVYTSTLFSSDKFDVLLMLLAFLAVALIACKRKWADIVSFIMFAFYIIGVAKNLASLCQDRNAATLKICVNTLAVYVSDVWNWFTFTSMTLSIITMIFLLLSIFKKKDLDLK